MGLKASFTIARRSLMRRKTKNLSAILAITLGVSLLVGIQITTDTLENAFLTSLLQSEGEVDIRVSSANVGGYLKADDQEKIRAMVPDAVGIMPELSTQLPMMVGSQFDPSVRIAGIPSNFSEAFGSFYDWKSGEKMDIGTILTDNSSILLSSRQAESLGLNPDTSLPVSLDTEVANVTLAISINSTTGLPVVTPIYAIESIELN
ncbi:MAG: ABC transporter permease, partial [Candidatus Bathyarchaeota archaeon]